MSKLNLEILAYEESPLGLLCLRRRELLSQPGTIVTEVTLNHEFLMSSLYTDSERALARTALEMHSGDDLRVLVGGLGLGYTAREALLSEYVAKVEVVELLPQVIDWLRRGLVPLSTELCNEQRLVLTEGDVYRQLAGAPDDLFDVILIDVDHSPEERLAEESALFYTTQGLLSAVTGDIWWPTVSWGCGPTLKVHHLWMHFAKSSSKSESNRSPMTTS